MQFNQWGRTDFDSAIRRFESSRPSQLKMIADNMLGRSRIVFLGVILNRILTDFLKLCSLDVPQPMCMAFSSGG